MTPNLVLFGISYILLAGVFSYIVRGLEIGEMCSAYALIPIVTVLAVDYGLEKLNVYLAKRVDALKKRVNLPFYMSFLNSMMYISVYTAGAFWAYRLTGKYILVPALFLIGLISGGVVVFKHWRE